MCEQIIFIHSAKLFSTLNNSPVPLAQGIQLHVRALDLIRIPCLIPCHRCEKSARDSCQTHYFDQATWQHPCESHRHVQGSAWIYDVRMAQFALKIEKLSHIIGARGLTVSIPDYGSWLHTISPVIIWQGSLEVNLSVLIGSFLVGTSPHTDRSKAVYFEFFSKASK